MNALLRSTFSSTLAAALCVAAVSAQAPDAATALARAQVLENQEADLAAAEQAYRALLADGKASAVHGEASLRLGTLLWRLDRKDDGKPFLERAVATGGDVATRATAVLQGQDEAGKQAQERLEKARALAALYQELAEKKGSVVDDGATEGRMRVIAGELQWLGPQGAMAIVDAIRQSDSKDGTAEGKRATARGLAGCLWQIGTPPAAAALHDWAQSPNVALRRAIAEGTSGGKVATDLEPVLLEFLRDPDPTGEVYRSVIESVTRLPLAQHLQLARESHPGLAAAGLLGLQRTWGSLPAADRDQVIAQLGPAIRRATTANEARVARAAWNLLATFVVLGPRSAQSLFLAEAPRFPRGIATLQPNDVPDLDDAWLHELNLAGQALGRQSVQKRQRDDGGYAVAEFLTRGKARWTAAGVDDAMTLLELGYGASEGDNAEWIVPCTRLANASQYVRFVRALSAVWDPHQVIRQLGDPRPPAEAFPALRDLVEACLGKTPPAWSRGGKTQARMVRTRRVEVPVPHDSVLFLCTAIANTNTPDAAAWFAALVDQHPALAPYCATHLIRMSGNGVGAPAQEALRKLLVWPGTDENELHREERSQVFAELARVGDVAAIPLFQRAYELGLGRVAATGGGFTAKGIGFLGERKDYGNRAPTGPWHGYGEQDLITAWRTLLESKAADQVWDELSGSNPSPQPTATTAQGGQSREFEIPQAVLPIVCKYMSRRWASAQGDEAHRELQNGLLSGFHRIPRSAVEGDSELARNLRVLLKAEDTELAMSVFASLPHEVGLVFADEARSALRRAPRKGWVTHLLRAGIDLPVDDWRELLRSQERNGLVEVLKGLPPQHAAALRREVEATLPHGQPEVRVAACQAMQRLYATDAVPNLLPLLQDPSDDVRKAARASLDQLREEYERRTFWADAKSGIDVSPTAAAAKLLAQAKAGEAKEQRLLAMQSLGVLGAAEALPYLIEWTKDPDANIATQAHNTILQIHRKARAAEPDKK